MRASKDKNGEWIKTSGSSFHHPVARREFVTKSLILGTGVMGLDFLGEKLPVSPARLHAQISQGLTSQLHACSCATDGQLFHTIRFAHSWQSFFGNVNAQESNGSNLRFSDVDCSGIGGNLHVTAIAMDGVIWHTIRFANSWQSFFGNVNAQESNGSTLRFSSVDCAIVGGDLHVTAVDQNGIIWHTIRLSNGSWQAAFGNVNAQESNGGILRFSDVGCAAIDGNLHVTAVDQNGTIWHTIRLSNGSWQAAFGNVNNQESNEGNLRFSDVDCANVGDNLHVTAIATDGIDWHTIRFANSWQSFFGNVNAQESNGSSLRFSAIGAGGIV